MLATLAITTPQILSGVATTVFLLVCIMLILTILIQKPQGGGLAGAFGSSAGSGQTAFGAKTGDALTVFTIAVFVLYIGGAILLNYLQRPAKIDPTAPAAQATPGANPAENSGTPLPATGTTSPGATPVDATPATPGVAPTPAPIPVPAPTVPAAPEGQVPAAPAPAPAPTPTPAPAPGR